MRHEVKKRLAWLTGLVVPAVIAVLVSSLFAEGPVQTPKKGPADWMVKNDRLKAGHSKYPILQQDFKSGDDITKACLTCHTHADEDFRKTLHWTWLAPGPDKDTPLGKAGFSLNNFCISTNQMNDKSCLDCHSGWNGKEGQINCLACHSQKDFNFSDAFSDIPYLSTQTDDMSREIVQGLKSDMKEAIQSIVVPERKNCGSCHFKGGGGNGVKHGDLDTSLTNPPRTLDVHMSPDGGNFTCVRCHTTSMHAVAGRSYTTPAVGMKKSLLDDDQTSRINCESCHGFSPHKTNAKLNDHAAKVACQTCHIPAFARGGLPTKMWWDWSKAGVLKDGVKIKTEDYMTIKGEFKWEKDVKPTYFWYNGALKYITMKDTIDPSKTVKINEPMGSMDDPGSRIFPFKVFMGKQPYDSKFNKMVDPLVSGKEGYWETLDWKSAIDKGMSLMGIPYSGEFGFVETSSVFPITHMVAPKENALSCVECHSRHGRLENLTGFYMPGTGRTGKVGKIGWTLVALALSGVLTHGIIRIAISGRRSRRTP